MGEIGKSGLEGSCGAGSEPGQGDWWRQAPSSPGIERFEAFFAGHAFDSHRHDSYALGITLAGVQSFDYRGARADSLPGDVIILHPDERHNGRAGQAGGFRYRMLYLSPRLIAEALPEEARALPFVRDAVSADARLRCVLRRALGDLERALEPLAATEIVLGAAEALRARDPSLAAVRTAPAAHRAVEQAREFLEANLERQVDAAELETVSGLGRYALARQFRARLGTSPYRYRTLRRLESARDLIVAGHSLADAAFASGFADQSHMTRQFKDCYGISPGRWRKLRRT